MKTSIAFMGGVIVGSIAVPIALITACVIVELRDPSNVVQSEVVTEEEK